ncbi:SCO family protein [Psychromonas sp. KJ10-2]|uniref:SCO family protein n=1 Tax=Psychromonas sp. KJ10-2 TaxID=3391822 RepID=UPI0039B682A0
MKPLIIVFTCIMMGFCLLFGVLQASALNTSSRLPFVTDNKALVLNQSHPVLPDFAFQKAGKVAFTNASLKGKWTLFFVGYTFCPDVCPTTLANLDRVYPLLPNDPDNTTQVVFVSVDPNRDKAEQLADYVNYFNPNFIGVTGTHKQLWPFVTQLGLIYSIVEESEQEQYYLVDHSASIVLINPEGEFHATFKSVRNEQGINQVDMDLMVEDIKKIQASYQQGKTI